jgi:hypothetical protein
VEEIADMALAKGSSMIKLKAIELLSRMQGYNEPELVKHDHIHIRVDSALINELRSGYVQLAERTEQVCLPLVSATPLQEAGAESNDALTPLADPEGSPACETC